MAITGTKNAYADITKEKLCRAPEFISAKISPDGKLLAKVGANEAGIANVVVLPVTGDSTSFTRLSSFTTPEIVQFFWSADSKKVLLLKDENGTGQLNLHGFDVESKEHISYTGQFTGVTAKVIKLSPSKNQALVGLNDRNPHFHDLYLLDLDSGNLSLVLQNDIYAKFLVSDELEVVLKMKINEDGSWTVFLKNNDVFLNLISEEAFQAEFISYNSSNKVVYFLDNRFTNTNQLTQKSIVAPFQEDVLGGQDFSDVDEVLFVQGFPKAYASYYTQKKWHVLDTSIQKDIEFLSQKVGSNFELVSQNLVGNTWIVSNSIPDKGVYFWMYDRDATKLKQISPSGTNRPESYAKMYEMVATARDGEKLVCYFTIPKKYDKAGYVDKPIPLVVVPHGGPFKVRDKFEFNSYHQWLASCGYAVLSVNFRLSSGFGKAFVNAGNGQWGGKAHTDVIDAIEACITRGLTETGKLAIFGGSYGGYESLAALTFTPDYFTCCVAICGPSNLKTVLGSVPKFWEFTAKALSDNTRFFTKQAFITSMGGNPETEKGAQYLEKCSPLNHLDKIQAPLLLVHGKNDHVVPEKESKQIYDSMKKHGKDVTYILFPNEGHIFGSFANKVMYLNQAELFLSQHLKGTYSPSENKLIADSTGRIYN
ncbi:MAG: Dipeptidyl aminopeptidase BIII [Chlamydiae bacterium]|nr:Dipeptidyl aminopeptidase BIII [Chlamydiota bacterium]